MINIIVATTNNLVIGNNGTLPWKLSNDLKFFKGKTTNNVVIMGRKTYESIGKPLPNRVNVIITRNKDYKIEGCYIEHSLTEAINKFNDKEIFIIGGGEIYKEALKLTNRIFLTKIDTTIDGDTYLPTNFLDKFSLINSSETYNENDYNYKFLEYINMEMKEKIKADIKTAMIEKNPIKRDLLRVILGEVEREEQTEKGRVILSDKDIINLIKKSYNNLKTVNDDSTKYELEILESYLPKQLSEDELKLEIERIIKDINATSIKDMKTIMGKLSEDFSGCYDGKMASNIIKKIIG